MTYARKSLVSLNDTPYYHLIARCVRRAWLWGFDEYAGKDYSHRKQWTVDRLTELSSMFAIDICAYAVMSNHYHLVVHVDQRRARSWSLQEVIERWCVLFAKPPIIDRWLQGISGEGEREVAEGVIELWRRRLCDVSWYMRCLNEYLARRANAEDQCTGRFWEGRFKSQALLDEAGLLTAMAYVDLNPIRAGIAATLEESEFTSIYDRIKELKALVGSERASSDPKRTAVPPLLAFGSEQTGSPTLPFTLRDYLELVEWTGRVRRDDKRWAIAQDVPPLLQRLNLDSDIWHSAMRPRGNVFGRALGRLDRMRLHANSLEQSWIRGMHRAERFFG